ncbi:MAG: Spy/CpxP family protein refolding chaperone [Salinivirgaceae bacterium]|jgi:Spy/CpxP family protein refolding chaperone
MRNLKMKTTLLGLIILIALSTSAQPGNNANCPRKGQNQGENFKERKADRMAEMLSLTEEQTKQIEKLQLENQKKMLPLRNDLNEKQARMKTLETAETPDLKAINSLIDEMAVIKTKMAKDRAANHQEVRKLLNEEQRIKFDMHAGKRGMGGRNGMRGKNCMYNN